MSIYVSWTEESIGRFRRHHRLNLRELTFGCAENNFYKQASRIVQFPCAYKCSRISKTCGVVNIDELLRLSMESK